MFNSSVVKFLRLQHEITISEETLKLVNTTDKTRRDVDKVLWELRRQIKEINKFFAQEESYSGIDESETEWLQQHYDSAEKKCYELVSTKS